MPRSKQHAKMRPGAKMRGGDFITGLFVFHLLLAACSAIIVQLPLKKLDSSRAGTASKYLDNESKSSKHRSQRSVGKHNLSSMYNNLEGESGEGYFTTIVMGNPPQKLQVLIDTGSANFAVACEDTGNLSRIFHRKESKTYQDANTEVYVPYTEGSWTGILGSDFVALASSKPLTSRVNIACITKSEKFFPPTALWQGILGLAYAKLARPTPSIVPFWDSVEAAHPKVPDIFSIQLCGSSFMQAKDTAPKEGSLILGGVLPQLATSRFLYAPIYREWYYEIILTDISVQSKSLNLNCKEYNMDKTIVDSGTTSIRLPVKVFKAVQEQITAHIQLLAVVSVPHQSFFDGIDIVCYSLLGPVFHAFPVISFGVMSGENQWFRLNLSPQHYLRPVPNPNDLNAGHSCVKFGISTSTTGTVLGAVFMEAFYVVFDRAHKRLGFAPTSCSAPDSNDRVVSVAMEGPFNVLKNFTKCAFKKPEASQNTFISISYVLLSLSLVVFVPLMVMAALRLRKTVCRKRHLDNDEMKNVLTLSSGGH